jgi:hypothetical protein
LTKQGNRRRDPVKHAGDDVQSAARRMPGEAALSANHGGNIRGFSQIYIGIIAY